MKTISILGCGWLGIPLAENLIADGFRVNGSTTSPNKITALQTKGITPFLIALEADAVEGDIQNFLQSDILIIDIPPRFHFSHKIAALVPHIIKSGIKKVLLVSSISVYADDNAVLTEADIPDPKTDKSKQLFDAEMVLQNRPEFQTTVVRFGGLFDEKRHPVKYLAGEANLENPGAPVNLIHQTDCIGIIRAIFKKEIWGETFNAAAPSHPTREEYYTRIAKQMQLIPPRFTHAKSSLGKTIDPKKVQDLLGYSFRFGDL